MRLNLRDLFWFILVVSLALGWWVESRRLRIEHARITAAIPADLIDVACLARELAISQEPILMISKEDDHRARVLIGRKNEYVVGGEWIWFKMQKADGKWEIEELEKTITDELRLTVDISRR